MDSATRRIRLQTPRLRRAFGGRKSTSVRKAQRALMALERLGLAAGWRGVRLMGDLCEVLTRKEQLNADQAE